MMDSLNDFHGLVNLVDPQEFSMRELTELVQELVSGKSKLEFRPIPLGDLKQRRPDIELAKLRLGWEPKVDLKDGLKRTIAYFDRLLCTSEPKLKR